MPPSIAEMIAAFVAEHHVEQTFFKRQRDRGKHAEQPQRQRRFRHRRSRDAIERGDVADHDLGFDGTQRRDDRSHVRGRARLGHPDEQRRRSAGLALEREIHVGARFVGEETLNRFYILHCIAIPLAASLLLAIHFWRVRKDGGISGPL